MSFENPTALQLGRTGTLSGKKYRVAGRVVMGMEEEGETYYWQEFNLVETAGDSSATLVYEETDNGPGWRLFTYIDPPASMTAAEAAKKRVGDSIRLGEETGVVTLVDESRVYHIEGEAPEGVEVGDIARYFNVMAGGEMFVVSWTGEEVEFYRGHDIRTDVVRNAFGLEEVASDSYSRFAAGDRRPSSLAPFVRIAVVLFSVFGVFIAFAVLRFQSRPSRSRIITAPKPILKLGSDGVLNDNAFRIRQRVTVQVGRVGSAYQWQEYRMLGDARGEALLICGLVPGSTQWHLFVPVQPEGELKPTQAGGLKMGQTVNVAGQPVTVHELFTAKVVQSEGADSNAMENWYGFLGEAGGARYLARWTEKEVLVYRGEPFAQETVLKTFHRVLPGK